MRKTRGVSAVVGVVFIVAIVFSVVTGYFLFQMSTNALIQQAANQRVQLDAVAASENFFVAGWVASNGQLYANITNIGPSTIQISAVIVGNATTNVVYSVNSSTPPNFLGPLPDRTANINPAVRGPVETGYTYRSGQVWIKAVTVNGAARFTLYPLPTANGAILTALTAGAIGDIYLDFQTYSYYRIVSCGTSTSHYCLQNPKAQAFTIPSGSAGQIAYAVRVTNLNPLQKTITLDNFTYLFQFWGVGSSFRGAGWFILSNSSINIDRIYNPISLYYNVSTTIVFGNSGGCPPATPVSPFSPENPGGSCSIPSSTLASTFIFAHGWKGIPPSSTPNYGQNIPFVTTLYT